MGRPGEFIRESPGRSHTLYSEHGMKPVFWLNGALVFLDEEDRVMETVDRRGRRPRESTTGR